MRTAGRVTVPWREWPGAGRARKMRGVLRRTLIVLLVALALAAPAGAGTIVVKLGLAPGKLAVASGTSRVAARTTVAVPVRVADGRGSGNGWTLRLADATGLSVVGITAKCAPHSTCTLPELAAGPSGARVLQAARESGMGVIDLVVTIRASAATSVSFLVT
jgi:hypothetical protein